MYVPPLSHRILRRINCEMAGPAATLSSMEYLEPGGEMIHIYTSLSQILPTSVQAAG